MGGELTNVNTPRAQGGLGLRTQEGYSNEPTHKKPGQETGFPPPKSSIVMVITCI
jgi:hypothetical protein